MLIVAAALVLPAAAFAKGPSEALVTGPGIDDDNGLAIAPLGDGADLTNLSGFFPASFGQSPDPMLDSPPEGTLGPKYRIRYTVPGPSGWTTRSCRTCTRTPSRARSRTRRPGRSSSAPSGRRRLVRQHRRPPERARPRRPPGRLARRREHRRRRQPHRLAVDRRRPRAARRPRMRRVVRAGPLDLHHQDSERVIGVYLLETDDGPALFDCGPSSCSRR